MAVRARKSNILMRLLGRLRVLMPQLITERTIFFFFFHKISPVDVIICLTISTDINSVCKHIFFLCVLLRSASWAIPRDLLTWKIGATVRRNALFFFLVKSYRLTNMLATQPEDKNGNLYYQFKWDRGQPIKWIWET